jgi:hypothetical protein
MYTRGLQQESANHSQETQDNISNDKAMNRSSNDPFFHAPPSDKTLYCQDAIHSTLTQYRQIAVECFLSLPKV